MEKVRLNVLRLAQMITSRSTELVTPKTIEYRALSALMDDEMVYVATKLKVRKPKVFSEIQKLTGYETERLEAVLDRLLMAGICEFSFENPQHEKQYFVDIPVSGSSELAATNPWQLENIPEVSEYFELCSREPLEPIAGMVGPGGNGVGMHVIPVEKEIEKINTSVEVEHLSYWMKKYNKFALWPCQCRLMRQHNGLNTGNDVEEWCIAIGDFADYIVETNRGKYATYEEVEEVLRKADENGFVHQVTNIDGQDKIFIICNCNVSACLALRTSQLFNNPYLSRSAYTAKVTTDNCVACGKCVEHCPAGAVKLGQKLGTVDGPVEYPKHISPDDKLWWGKKDWDEDFADTNRINCYDSGTAPCKTACPAHIAIQGYLQLAKEGRYDEALELIKMDNPFPAICGRVCNKRCEAACTRASLDQAVAIDDVKNFLAQRDLDAETRYIPKKVIPKVHGEFSEKIAIIGAGPAGLSAAFYLAKLGYTPTVFEREAQPGGMMTYGIPSFKLEKNVVAAEIDVLKEMGVEFRCGVNVGEDVTIPELRKEGYKAFYIAIGCQGSRKAGIPGENAKDVVSAVDFLKEALSAERKTLSGNVVVVGGGNVAIDVARTAMRSGAESVTMFSLEQRAEMPASDDEIEEALEENVALQNGWGPKEILLDADGNVTGVTFKKCISVFDTNHRFAPQYDENDTMTVDANYVVTSIGQSIDWGNLLEGLKVEHGRGNGLVIDEKTYQVKGEPDLFVGGDVMTGPKFVIDAIAEGHMASEVLHRYVRDCVLSTGRDLREFIELDKTKVAIAPDQYDRPARQVCGTNPSIDAKTSFQDARLLLTEEQVKLETSRCLSCGASVVDEKKCIGCGVCTNQCKFDAIHLYRDRPDCTDMYTYENRMKAILPWNVKRATRIVKKQIHEMTK